MSVFSKVAEAIGREGTGVLGIMKLAGAANKEIKKIEKRDGVIDFERDPDGSWYADFEHWPLDRSHLLMVAGADDLLDEMCKSGENRVSMKIKKSKTRISVGENAALLRLTSRTDGGMSGNYAVEGNYDVKKVWICPVINFIFKGVPNFIVFENVTE